MTSTTKHTPGPWRADVFRRKCRVLASNGAWLATAEHAPEDDFDPGDISWSAAHANARLIAAAPDMLGALQKIANGWATMDELDMRDIALAAIAKATTLPAKEHDR
jgi:hypothetical protein